MSRSLLHIATHDSTLIDRLTSYIETRHVPPSAYEYAMLYGIQEPLQHRLVEVGRRVRVRRLPPSEALGRIRDAYRLQPQVVVETDDSSQNAT